MYGKRALVVGGSNAISLAMALQLEELEYEKIYIVDRIEPDCKINNSIFIT